MTAPERKPPSKAFLTLLGGPLNPLAPLRSSGSLSLSLSLGGWFSRILPRWLLPLQLDFTAYKRSPIFLLHSLATSRLLESPPKLLPLFAFNAPLFFPASPPRLRRRRRRHPAHACEKTGGCMLVCCSLFVSYSARKVNEFTRYEIVFVAAYLE